jgi:glyoxylase-like metal-dependent hydrolase (beta-lactamase superfamily II)
MTETDNQPAAALPPPLVQEAPVEVADGVVVIPDGRVPLVPNVGIVLGGRDALVVDTGMGLRSATRVLEHARERAGDRRLLLTITHFHPEHGYGAQVIAREATIVYNRAQRDELHAKGEGYIEMFKGFGENVAAELEGVELVEPHVVYDGEADLDLGGRRALLRAWGLTHTRGDQVVFLPDEGVLFTGDLVETRFFPIFPFFPPDDADVDGSRWIEVLERLERLEPRVVVPGHGEVGDAGLVTAVREYLVRVRDEVRQAKAVGATADEAVAALEPGLVMRYPDWDAPEWIGYAIRCFHAR